MIFWRYTALFFSAIALLSLQKMPGLSPKSLSQNAELILCPLLRKKVAKFSKAFKKIVSFISVKLLCTYFVAINIL